MLPVASQTRRGALTVAAAVFACIVYAAALSGTAAPPPRSPPAPVAREPLARAAAGPPVMAAPVAAEETADALQAFGAALLGRLVADAAPGENVFISPLSIASALAMVAAGSTPGSDVASAFRAVLRCDAAGDSDAVAASLRALGEPDASADGVTLRSANSLWARARVRPEFAADVARAFAAHVAPLSGAAPVNDWVRRATDGHIGRIVGDDVASDPLTIALLVNAVFFKAPWATPFDAERTRDALFRAHAKAPGGAAEELPCRMMSAKPRQMLYAETAAGTAVALPYGGGRFRALLALPAEDSPAGLMALASAATDGNATGSSGGGGGALRELRAQLSSTRVLLSLPRFKLEYGVASLKPALLALGLGPAFAASPKTSREAGGFSRLSPDPDAHLSDVLHKAVVEVTEEGTVAAAATAAVMATRSIAMPAPPKQVTFDRPFVMAIEDAATGAPLFVGTVARPHFL